jgi:hypothetical protein
MAHPFDISPGLLLNNLGKQVASYNPADSYFRRLTVDSVYHYNMVAHLWQAVVSSGYCQDLVGRISG